MVAGGCCARGKGNHQLNPNYITGFVDHLFPVDIIIFRSVYNTEGLFSNLTFLLPFPYINHTRNVYTERVHVPCVVVNIKIIEINKPCSA